MAETVFTKVITPSLKKKCATKGPQKSFNNLRSVCLECLPEFYLAVILLPMLQSPRWNGSEQSRAHSGCPKRLGPMVVRDLSVKVTFEQRHGGGEEVNYVEIWLGGGKHSRKRA